MDKIPMFSRYWVLYVNDFEIEDGCLKCYDTAWKSNNFIELCIVLIIPPKTLLKAKYFFD